MLNDYEAKLEAKRERYAELAEKNEAKASAAFRRGDMSESATGIPFGQPILVGHHSEGRHRAAIKRSDSAMRSGIEASKKAGYYAEKAASVGTAGISSDDPEAITKLQAKIDKAEASQEYMKQANMAIKACYKAGVREDGPEEEIATLKRALFRATGAEHTEKQARGLMAKDFCGRLGFPSYSLSNNNANIRRMEQRIETLKAAQGAVHKESEVNGVRVVENVEENRIQLFFPGKPSADVRGTLKASGFRWARSNGCWQRHLNNAGRWASQRVLAAI